MRRANEAIIRGRHPVPTADEVLQSMNGSTVFSKLDLRWGYHQLELTPESREITTFACIATNVSCLEWTRRASSISTRSQQRWLALLEAITYPTTSLCMGPTKRRTFSAYTRSWSGWKNVTWHRTPRNASPTWISWCSWGSFWRIRELARQKRESEGACSSEGAGKPGGGA